MLATVCPFREKCTQSKNYQKVVTRHVWEEFKEHMNENRYTENCKKNYPKRKETIERIFGDCKEQHCLRYSRVRGLEKNKNNATMIFACHNLKKMAMWRWKSSPNTNENKDVFYRIWEFLKFIKQKAICLN